MKKKLFTIWMVLLIAMLATSPVYAGGVSVKWGSGSIIAEGYAYGFSRDAVSITLHAEGIPHVSCLDPGNGNVVPGQNPVTVEGNTSANLAVQFDENGKFAIKLEAQPDVQFLSPVQLGCPNNNWTARVDWVNWYYATITVTENSTGKTLWFKAYNCTSTPNTVDCKAIK